ncbi:MAG: glycoside hydrolase family 95 protein [Planctomycetes bacterium]|nr:glycoside hydrolase family 95 protein [Planctomycetota bacterium]
MSTRGERRESCVSRRYLLLGVAAAEVILGIGPLAGTRALARAQSGETPAPGTLCLWYDRPAKAWMTDALPIGNGPMGAMLFGGTEVERVQFNEISLWSGDRVAVDGPVAGRARDEQQNLGAYQAFGDIFIHLGHDFAKVTEYRRELDIDRAVHRVTYEYNGVRYEQTAFASYPDGVVVVHLTANKAAAYTGRVRLADMHNARIAADGKKLISTGKFDNGFEYEAQLLVLNENGDVAVKSDDAPSTNPWNIAVPATCLVFDRCDSVTLILGAGTNFVQDHTRQWLGEHPHAAVGKRVDKAAAQSVKDLLASHVKDYQSLFRRFSLDVGTTAPDLLAKSTLARLESYVNGTMADPNLEALFCQFGRYLLISCSRPGSLPANLQGVWNDSNEPAWAGDYHSNINLEMNYWPAEPANLAECHLPFIDYVSSIREVSAANTRRNYGNVRGWTVQTMNNACGVSFWKWNPPGSAWYARHLWEHFAFGRDVAYLRTTAYPVLKEVCQFWDDHLKQRPDGMLVTPDGWSPEHGPAEEGVTYDQEIVYDLFTNTTEAADVLGDDGEFRDHIAGLRDKLLKPKIGRWGQLQEWEQDKDDPKDDHRHVSHLFALYPGRQISRATTPELAEAARVSLQARGDRSTGWSRAWKINFWARLWDGDHAYTMLRSLLTVVRETETIYGASGAGVYPNLLDSHPPFQIDGNFGATAGICEMLLQSHADGIHLLPALPKAWPTGRVSGLCARGGFEVDMSWEQGQLTKAVIHSKAGLPCRVVCGDKVWEFSTTAGSSYPLTLAPGTDPHAVR